MSAATGAVDATKVKTAEETKAPEAPGFFTIDGFNTKLVQVVTKNVCCGKEYLKLDAKQNFFMKALRITAVALLAIPAYLIATVKWVFRTLSCGMCSSEKPKDGEEKKEVPKTDAEKV